MKLLTLLLLVCTGLAGCVVAPYGDPAGVYVAPIAPSIVVRPYGYGGGYYGGPRHRYWR